LARLALQRNGRRGRRRAFRRMAPGREARAKSGVREQKHRPRSRGEGRYGWLGVGGPGVGGIIGRQGVGGLGAQGLRAGVGGGSAAATVACCGRRQVETLTPGTRHGIPRGQLACGGYARWGCSAVQRKARVFFEIILGAHHLKLKTFFYSFASACITRLGKAHLDRKKFSAVYIREQQSFE
jgi:hypothetical protein